MKLEKSKFIISILTIMAHMMVAPLLSIRAVENIKQVNTNKSCDTLIKNCKTYCLLLEQYPDLIKKHAKTCFERLPQNSEQIIDE